MRDLDLIVSVTTVANDPIWLEECRGHPGLDRYWEAVMRRILVRAVRWHGESTVPGPVRLDAAGASRADQLCLDIPPGAFDRECAFWAALTGWDLRSGARPEFAYLDRPAPMPARLLFQRRDSAGPRDRVSGHVDFACADRERLAARHAAAGARILAEFPYWTTLADPTGRPYCLTMRDPETGKLP